MILTKTKKICRPLLSVSYAAFLSLGLVSCNFAGGGTDGSAYLAAERLSQSVAEYQVSAHGAATVEPKDFRLFSQVYREVTQKYVEPVNGQALILAGAKGIQSEHPDPSQAKSAILDETATKSLLSTLDQYSEYLDQESYAALQENIQGVFGGLGIEINKRSGRLVVVAPIEGTPAEKAGIKSGDIITHADGESIDPLTQREAVRLLRGKPGTTVRLTILREGAGSFEVDVTRARIEDNPVRWHLEGDVGYIRITNFSDKAAGEVTKAVERIQEELGPFLAGFVLDLRNNPGGVLRQAVETSSIFLDGGVVVSVRSRRGEDVLRADRGDMTNDAPLVILINGGSASASEIVSGAIQDRNRGFLVGQSSFGKGTVQTIIPLQRRQGLKLTTAKYLTPDGKSVEGGISPDQPMEQDPDREGDEQLEEALKLVIHMAGGPRIPWGAGMDLR